MVLPNTIVREAWLWLAGSLVLAMLWSNLSWLFSPWAHAEKPTETTSSLAERIVFRLANWQFAPSLLQGLRLLYYVGLPSAALFWGRDAVVGRLLGLQRLALPTFADTVSRSGSLDANWSNWLHDLGWAAVLGLSSLGLLLLAAYTQRRALSDVRSRAQSDGAPGWKVAREALYHEIHWAFYRNAPIVALGSYWGTWAGLALVALEALVNPVWRRGLRETGYAWSRMSRGAMAVLSSLLYLRTQNLWLALLLHWGISWTLEATYRAPSTLLSEDAPFRD
jgi:hypothetical protein